MLCSFFSKKVREKSKVEDTIEKAEKSKGQWACPIAQMKANRWARKQRNEPQGNEKEYQQDKSGGGEMESNKRLVPGGCKWHKTGTSGYDCGGLLPWQADRRRRRIALYWVNAPQRRVKFILISER